MEMPLLAVKVPADVLKRLDAYVDRVGRRDGCEMTRARAVRALLDKALVAEEKRGR